ncbi:MAG TPA: hypothetical protein VFD51_01595 [Patescibacteria group bacterium]|nr:hypothetical protein [Patescibacteria group bacterium]
MLKSDNNQDLPLIRPKSPIWLSVSEAASLGGVKGKTIRRALKDTESGLVFKIVKNRYQIQLGSLIIYMHRNIKLNNKFLHLGLGQYVKKWKDK